MPTELVGTEARTPATGRPDGPLTALILGFFAAAWFGWAQGGAPAGWSIALTVGSALSLVVAALGAVRTWRKRTTLRAGREAGLSKRYGQVVGITYAIIALGAVILGTTGHPEFIAPWVAFVVGVHFWALVPVLADRALLPLGIVVVAVAGCAVVLAWTTATTPNVVTGAGTGAALLVAAVHGLLRRA